jgi:hypothetical protein
MQTLKPEKIIETISNLKTGEVYKNDEEWKAKNVPEQDIGRLKTFQNKTLEEMSKLLCQALIYLEKPSKVRISGIKSLL